MVLKGHHVVLITFPFLTLSDYLDFARVLWTTSYEIDAYKSLFIIVCVLQNTKAYLTWWPQKKKRFFTRSSMIFLKVSSTNGGYTPSYLLDPLANNVLFHVLSLLCMNLWETAKIRGSQKRDFGTFLGHFSFWVSGVESPLIFFLYKKIRINK